MKTQKLISLILALITLLSVVTVTPSVGAAYRLRCGDFLFKVLDDGTLELLRYFGKYGNSVDLNIPTEMYGYKITRIGNGCFSNLIPKNSEYRDFRNFNISDSILYISKNAFSSCKIQKLTIGKNLYSFHIRGVYVTDKVVSVNKNFKVKDGLVFNKNFTKILYCPRKLRLRNYKIPKSVKIISEFAFEECEGIRDVSLNKVTKLENACFCYSSIKRVIISNNVKYIGKYAFANCDNLKKIQIAPNDCLKICSRVFARSGIKTLILSQKTGKYAFEECEKLSKVTIPDNVKKIEAGAFFDCIKLKSVTIPPTVKRIGELAFGYRSSDDRYEKTDAVYRTNFIIKGKKGSAAEKYAKKNGIQFKAVKL